MRYFSPTLDVCTAALQSLLDQGPGIVRLEAGEYRCAGLRIPDRVMLVGEGAATVLKLSGGNTIFQQEDAGNWALRDLVLEGTADGDWMELRDEGENGLSAARCWGYEIAGVEARGFRGAGIRIAHTPLFTGQAPFCNGGNLDRVTVLHCHAGLCFDVRGEYLNATAVSAGENVTGVVIYAGNVKLAASNICSNIDGVYIEDKENGSHGALGNCLINHNRRHALWCCNVRNGMSVQNCDFFYGDITIEDSQGIVINGGELCCNLFTSGQGVNSFTDNYVIPYPGICDRFELTEETIVKDNFTDKGPFERMPFGLDES